MKKIGIVGGGLAGLSCAYRLSQKGDQVTVFEKEALPGGRIQYAAAIGSEKFQDHIVALIKDLGLDEMKSFLKPEEIGFFGDAFLALEDFPPVLQQALGPEGMKTFGEFSQFVNAIDFDPISPSPELLKLRKVSLAEYGAKFTESVQGMAFVAAKILSEEDDLNKISADYGLHLIRMGNEVMSGKAICFEEVNLMSLSNVLTEEIRQKGGEVSCNHEVKRVSRKGEGFEISTDNLGQKETADFDAVVFALPLVHLKDIFPDLEFQSDVRYPQNKILICEGKLKYPQRKLLMGLPGNPFNLRLFLNFVSSEQYFLPWDKDKPVNLGFLYDKYRVVLEKEIFPLPCLPPQAKVPELKTSIRGVYLAGDFYHYPYDVSVCAGEAVAELISQER